MISVVTVSRNDDHGGNITERTQRHIDCLYDQANTFGYPVEYIMVEWNPPADRPPITDAIDFHHETEYWKPRIITVPREIHATFEHSDKLPLYQMIGKNVGIRRATGDWILATNIDILLSDEMFAFIHSGILQKRQYLRADRLDVPCDVPNGSRLAMLTYCEQNVIRRNGYHAVHDLTMPFPQRVFYRAYHALKYMTARELFGLPGVHTMASGDFSLLHKDDWTALHGYPEWHVFSPHIDSIFLYQAWYSGIRQHIVGYPIYHIEHSYGMVPGEDKRLFNDIAKRGIPVLPMSIVIDIAREMRSGGAIQDLFWHHGGYWICKENIDHWGLETEHLPEVTP
jgi:hypothetical protein